MLPLPPGAGQTLAMPSVVRAVLGSVPATIAVLIGALILLAGFFAGHERRTYALKAANCTFDAAAMFIGSTKPRRQPSSTRKV